MTLLIMILAYPWARGTPGMLSDITWAHEAWQFFSYRPHLLYRLVERDLFQFGHFCYESNRYGRRPIPIFSWLLRSLVSRLIFHWLIIISFSTGCCVRLDPHITIPHLYFSPAFIPTTPRILLLFPFCLLSSYHLCFLKVNIWGNSL